MQTQFENAKIETAHSQKKAKELGEANEEANQKIVSLQKTLNAKAQDLQYKETELSKKEESVQELNNQIEKLKQ